MKSHRIYLIASLLAWNPLVTVYAQESARSESEELSTREVTPAESTPVDDKVTGKGAGPTDEEDRNPDDFLDGEVKLFKFPAPKVTDESQEKVVARIFNLKFPTFKVKEEDSEIYALISSPLGVEKAEFPLELMRGGEVLWETKVPIVTRGNTRTDEVLFTSEEDVLPKKATLVEKIGKEDVALRETLKGVSPERLWKNKFIRPVPGKVTSPFGIYRMYSKHLRRRTHWGVDFRAPLGTPVKVSSDGVVVMVKDMHFPGLTVVVDHGMGLYTGYSHLGLSTVKVGDRVKMGQVIGTTGLTGKRTGLLLHWFAVNGRVKVDPMTLLKIQVP